MSTRKAPNQALTAAISAAVLLFTRPAAPKKLFFVTKERQEVKRDE